MQHEDSILKQFNTSKIFSPIRREHDQELCISNASVARNTKVKLVFPFKVSVVEHQVETLKSIMAREKGGHPLLCNEFKIINKEQYWRIRHMKVSIHVKLATSSVDQALR